ncbi:hypothetical protein STCU_05405 [Strigomonas culicis]|uniref:Leucine-rich repeat protein (LRRP) n=1 Tax=Strigomonas culicis TaxID=28005 RepID=S9UG71_9TRYP|nr:hypothetical protein STCU_05405 [Strigomonas culicis]|eukprot:EPY27933.1 hypothetical protein STCU_05405 [Strigomonas culicis]
MRAFLHYSAFFTGSVLPQLSALQALDISYTQIGDVAFRDMLRCLHKGVGGWHRLTSLGLAQCNVGEYAIELLSRGIQETDGETLEVLLESLNVNSNQLQDDTIFLLAGCLVQCKHLKVLDMRFNSMTKKTTAQLASSLMHASDLRVLRLRSNRIGDDGLAEIVPYVKYWPALEELDLTRCRLTSRSLVVLAAALPYLPELRVLSVAGNDLRPLPGLGAGTPAEELKLFAYDPDFMKGDVFHNRGDAKVPTSFELDRRDRDSGRRRYKGPPPPAAPEPGRARAATTGPYHQFGEALSLCRQLRTLDISDSSLQDESFAELASAAQLPALKELRLGANPLFATSVASLDQLAALIGSCAQLELLDLAFTGLGDLGLSLLCDGDSGASSGVLCSLKQLRVLQLSHCRVKSLGLEALAARVAEFGRLEKLLFDGNRVGLDDLIELLARTAELSRLEHLTLSECGHSGRLHREAVVRSAGYTRLMEKGVVVTL